ncbi:hypothetical protein SXCC_04241 [Gluconacetobacter sp. SXCC-1]|nr:hypothetical protein SXCC_04241 [Gluconacetobacter sp. SXCC-1]
MKNIADDARSGFQTPRWLTQRLQNWISCPAVRIDRRDQRFRWFTQRRQARCCASHQDVI